MGSNTGLFVYCANKRGWDAVGLEPNRWGVDFAMDTYGLSLINKPFGPGLFPKNSFDVITMWDVLEHFINPIIQMRNVYSYLKPGGVFAFSTVDPESFLARLMGSRWPWYMEMHRVLFSRSTVKRYLEEAGFKRIIFQKHIRYLSLGYLATRMIALHPALARLTGSFVKSLGLGKMIVPYYANDLYDCYAFK